MKRNIPCYYVASRQNVRRRNDKGRIWVKISFLTKKVRDRGQMASSCILSVCWGHRSVCFIVQDRNKNDRSRNAKSIKVDALALNAFSHVWLFKTNNRDETLITFHTLWGTRYNHPMVDLDTCRPRTTPGVQTNTKTQHLFATVKSIKSRD